METIPLTINRKKITCPADTTILEAAEQNNIKIPRLCYHPELKPFGACRMCLVEDEKTGRLMASCVTPVASDMAIQTATDRIIRHRRNIARLMISEHPESCIVCSKGNRCQLRQVAASLGIGETDLYHMPNFKPLEQANPFIIRDLSKCILCGKCIRADHELVVVGAIDYNLRGFGSRPATAHEMGLEQSGLEKLIVTSYNLLDLITFFTANENELRARTISRGTLAPQAAGKVHSDMEDGFIRAEVIHYEDLVAAGSLKTAREHGLMHLEGKEYVVRDGDMMYFRFQA